MSILSPYFSKQISRDYLRFIINTGSRGIYVYYWNHPDGGGSIPTFVSERTDYEEALREFVDEYRQKTIPTWQPPNPLPEDNGWEKMYSNDGSPGLQGQVSDGIYIFHTGAARTRENEWMLFYRDFDEDLSQVNFKYRFYTPMVEGVDSPFEAEVGVCLDSVSLADWSNVGIQKVGLVNQANPGTEVAESFTVSVTRPPGSGRKIRVVFRLKSSVTETHVEESNLHFRDLHFLKVYDIVATPSGS